MLKFIKFKNQCIYELYKKIKNLILSKFKITRCVIKYYKIINSGGKICKKKVEI